MGSDAVIDELVLPFERIGAADLPRVGGKGANLGEMLRAGMPVPEGFCVTTAAYDAFFATSEVGELLGELDALGPDDLEGLRGLAHTLRAKLEATAIPAPIAAAIRAALADQGTAPEQAWAVRSSATLEDLPEASFAGQQDTYLGVRGVESLLERVRACWASAFTDRAIIYRRQHGYSAGAAKLSVVVQRMVASTVSGILFTADPITGHRKVASVDASWGLGEALVSGIVDADNFRLDRSTGELLDTRLGAKAIEIVPTATGTETLEVAAERRAKPALDRGQLAALLALAERVEAHYQGVPQDIEWCFEGDVLYLVQTRPITTLYPLPAAPEERGLHVYISLNHIQVMTDVIHPLGADTLRHLFPVGKTRNDQPCALVHNAGGRVFIDITPALLLGPTRERIPRMMTLVDPKMAAIVQSVVARGGFTHPAGRPQARPRVLLRRIAFPLLRTLIPTLLWRDPARNRTRIEALLEQLASNWVSSINAAKSSRERLTAGRHFMAEGLITMMTQAFPTVLTGIISWKLLRRLTNDDPRVNDLTRGLEGNVTTQMDLELGDLADIARAHPELRAALREDPELLLRAEQLKSLPGGDELAASWHTFITRYGHRAIGEIDLSKTRWADDPASLVRNLAGLLGEGEIGAHRAQHEAAARQADATAAALVAEARGPRRWLIRRSIPRMRAGLGLREHPKYTVMRGFMALRQAHEHIAAELVEAGTLASRSDIWWLTYADIDAALAGDPVAELVAQRRQAYAGYAKLRPPRVITSEGEVPTLPRSKHLPPHTLEGICASTGVVEGIARVITDPVHQQLSAGEILVAPFTDPGWTPLFVQASAPVMEVGGLMTHGSVVAREYGIPAVVGVDDCTTKLRSGQRIRVDGDRGWVTVLD